MKLCITPNGYRSQLYLLPAGFVISFDLVGDLLTCEWWPREPSRAQLLSMLDQYRDARNDFLSLAGLEAVVIEAFQRGDRDALH